MPKAIKTRSPGLITGLKNAGFFFLDLENKKKRIPKLAQFTDEQLAGVLSKDKDYDIIILDPNSSIQADEIDDSILNKLISDPNELKSFIDDLDTLEFVDLTKEDEISSFLALESTIAGKNNFETDLAEGISDKLEGISMIDNKYLSQIDKKDEYVDEAGAEDENVFFGSYDEAKLALDELMGDR